jgi:hypothetical protein
MPDETPKRTIPRLRPKQRDLTQLDPTSLTAALYHRELLAQLGPLAADQVPPPADETVNCDPAAVGEPGSDTLMDDQPASAAPRRDPAS